MNNLRTVAIETTIEAIRNHYQENPTDVLRPLDFTIEFPQGTSSMERIEVLIEVVQRLLWESEGFPIKITVKESLEFITDYIKYERIDEKRCAVSILSLHKIDGGTVTGRKIAALMADLKHGHETNAAGLPSGRLLYLAW